MKRCKDNPYGYRLNVSDPEIKPLYDRYKKWKDIPVWCPLSDKERLEFEDYILGRRKLNDEHITDIQRQNPEPQAMG